jgi:hypothetical protein
MLREIKSALRSNFSSWGGSGTPISHSTPLPFSHLSYHPRKSSSRSYNRSPCRLHPTLQRHHLSLLHPSDIFQCRKHPTSALFAPGCKDYGTTELADSQTWRYTQNSHPQNPPPMLANRAHYSIKTFEHSDLFDAVVLRPANAFAYASSYYSFFFELAEG